MVAYLKKGIGNVYLQLFKNGGECSEEFLYDIVVNTNKNEIKIIAYENYNGGVKIFEGTPQEFCEKFDND